MHILCTICSDLVNQAENIYVTKCGHIFHNNCLSQWIARSKSCPQCRNKVTDKCMFRIYPTVSNENSIEDTATLQSRLDDAQLQLRQQRTTCNEREEKIKSITAELKKNEELLKDYEKKLVTKESAVAALKEQLKYVQIQNKETKRLKEENEVLNKNLQTLNGLQKVLNATSEEVEQMLQGYADIRTVATFATALKRALCDSERKKNESRDRIQTLKQQLTAEKRAVVELQSKLLQAEENMVNMKRKYKKELKQRRNPSTEEQNLNANVVQTKPDQIEMKIELKYTDKPIVLNNADTSFRTLVNKIENADSPYLNLKQSNLVLTALQRHPNHPLPENNLKPSEFAILNTGKNAVTGTTETFKNSIFHKKESTKIDFQANNVNLADLNISYDGLGGHSKMDVFPVPNTRPPLKNCIPKLSAKHKLKRPNPSSPDLEKFFKRKKQ
ncbi:E3 ubiquitin-protein ligase TRAIP [Zerene cesonia]|uniref:E3 ubiquitin-protein ligase TRAIP n=1 Tax=Zerene cesonia TaxID=33412 RepID=UPI0018E569FC|nr:E3 ubiquitin-protein ligase TRAIP [Zerene cesonia]